MTPHKQYAGVLARQNNKLIEKIVRASDMKNLLAFLCDIIQKTDAEKATNMIVERYADLYGLMVNNVFKFKHALYALMIPLIAKDAKVVLHQMSDDALNVLQRMIEISKDCICPKQIQETNKENFNRKILGEERYDLLQNVAIFWNDLMPVLSIWEIEIDNIKKAREKGETAQAMPEVFDENKYWTLEQLAVKCGFPKGKPGQKQLSNLMFALKSKNPEFKKLLDECFVVAKNVEIKRQVKWFVIEKFDEFYAFIAEHKEKVANKKIKPAGTIDLKELASKLGFKDESNFRSRLWTLVKLNKDREEEINSWFVFDDEGRGHKRFFKIEFMDKIIELFSEKRKRGPHSKAKKTEDVSKPVKQHTAKKADVKKTVQPKKAPKKTILMPQSSFDGLAGVKAFDLYLQELRNRMEDAQAKMQYAEQEYKETVDALSVAKNSVERTELLDKLNGVNDVLVRAEEVSKTCARGIELMEKRAAAQKALDDANAKIEAFMKAGVAHNM